MQRLNKVIGPEFDQVTKASTHFHEELIVLGVNVYRHGIWCEGKPEELLFQPDRGIFQTRQSVSQSRGSRRVAIELRLQPKRLSSATYFDSASSRV
jgi:hypothetical protein